MILHVLPNVFDRAEHDFCIFSSRLAILRMMLFLTYGSYGVLSAKLAFLNHFVLIICKINLLLHLK